MTDDTKPDDASGKPGLDSLVEDLFGAANA